MALPSRPAPGAGRRPSSPAAMGAVWSALLVGGGLAGALFVWLLRGGPEDAEQKDAPAGEAATRAEGQGGGGGRSPSKLGTKPEHPQESNGRLISETKDLGKLQEAARPLQNPSRDAREHSPSGHVADAGAPASSASAHSRSSSEASRSESLESPRGEWGLQKGREALARAGEELPSSRPRVDRAQEVGLAQPDSQGVSRHSSWGDAGLGGSLKQGMDGARNFLVEARGREVDGKPGWAAAKSAESRQVSVRFQVHYVTGTDVAFIAVTGDHERLGSWNTYIPLHRNKDGFWSHSVCLPADTVVQWKFVLVENGGVTRWEECSNRVLETGREDQVVHGWWGVH